MAKGGAVRWVVVENRFPAIIAGLERNADTLVRKAALDIEAQAKMRAPVDTGLLRASIQAARVGQAHWRVTVGQEYGLFVEYGTRFQAPQPYFAPAIDVVWPSFQSAMRRIIT